MRTRRAVLVLALATAVAATISLAVMAGGGSGVVNRQTQGTATVPAQKSNKNWSDIPGFSNLSVCSNQLITTNVNLTATGAAFRLRVLVDGGPQYGVARFDPTVGTRSFSYTFGSSHIDGNHNVDIQWRSVTGDTVMLKSGFAAMLYGACI
jgi:hypothetical protein